MKNLLLTLFLITTLGFAKTNDSLKFDSNFIFKLNENTITLTFENNFDISQEDYFKVIEAKTGVLFEACGKLASISNECSFNQKNSLSTIGEIFGQIYQLFEMNMNKGDVD